MVYSFYFYYAAVSIHETTKYLVNYRVIEGSKKKKNETIKKKKKSKKWHTNALDRVLRRYAVTHAFIIYKYDKKTNAHNWWPRDNWRKATFIECCWYTTYVTEIMIIIIKKKSKYAGQLVIGNWMKIKSLKKYYRFPNRMRGKSSVFFP